jgi:hypothetical protein
MRGFLRSGPASKEVAILLRKWVPRSIPDAELFVSDVDIKAGQRWARVLGKELLDRQMAVVCVTSDNAESRWLTFEAGAISNVVSEISDARVIPFLHRTSISSFDGPLTQFQAKTSDRNGYFALLQSMNESSSRPKVESELNDTLELFWPKIEKELEQVNSGQTESDVRDISDVLDNVIFSINDMRGQIGSIEKKINPASAPSARLEPQPSPHFSEG